MNHLADIVKQFSQKRIVVIGDAINDQFVHGQISRVSREAPVFILSHEHTETTPGGAGNCAANLAALGAKVALVSVVGDDEPGRVLLAKLNAAGIDCCGIVINEDLHWPPFNSACPTAVLSEDGGTGEDNWQYPLEDVASK